MASILLLILTAYLSGIRIDIRCKAEILKKIKTKKSDTVTNVTDNPVTSQLLSYISVVRYCGAKKRYAEVPTAIVTSNWLKLPTIVSNIAFSGSVFLRMKALPINSPTLLGVKTLTANPPSTASTEVTKLTFSAWLIRYRHFCDSMPQLITIRNINPTEI
jgi:hypothetical protein